MVSSLGCTAMNASECSDPPTGRARSITGVDISPTLIAAARERLKGEAHVTTNAYETRGPTLVYTLESSVQNFESRDQGLVTLVGPIVDQLRRDGVLR